MRVATSIGKPTMVNQTPFMIRSLGLMGRSLVRQVDRWKRLLQA